LGDRRETVSAVGSAGSVVRVVVTVVSVDVVDSRVASVGVGGAQEATETELVAWGGVEAATGLAAAAEEATAALLVE